MHLKLVTVLLELVGGGGSVITSRFLGGNIGCRDKNSSWNTNNGVPNVS